MNTSSATDDLLAGVREQCAALPEVTEALTRGAPTWFVRGRRSFVKFIDPEDHRFDELHVAFRAAAPPGARHESVAADPDRFFVPPFGGYDWVHATRRRAGRSRLGRRSRDHHRRLPPYCPEDPRRPAGYRTRTLRAWGGPLKGTFTAPEAA